MEQSLDRSAYTYDPEQFKRVFEDKFGYLAGVKRNSRRFASRRASQTREAPATSGPIVTIARAPTH